MFKLDLRLAPHVGNDHVVVIAVTGLQSSSTSFPIRHVAFHFVLVQELS